MPDLARKSARRIQRAQERMQAAVYAAEVERSETFSGRSTEDNEVLWRLAHFQLHLTICLTTFICFVLEEKRY